MTAVPPEALAAAFEACPFVNRDAAARLLKAAAPHIVAAENARIVKVMHDGFWALDNDTQAVLAAMMARWAAAMTDDARILGNIAALLDGAP